MPTIAQKLCRDIVEPTLSASSKDKPKKELSVDIVRNQESSDESEKNVKVIKQKAMNGMKASYSGGSNVRNLRSKEKNLNKNLVNIGINTLVSGSLRCDNNCVTLVHKRDQKPTCRCVHRKINYKMREKPVQATVHKICKDKACTNCIEKGHYVDQLVDCKSFMSNKIDIKPKLIEVKPVINHSTFEKPKSNCETFKKVSEKLENNYRPLNIRTVGAQRWSITNYPIRGPDF